MKLLHIGTNWNKIHIRRNRGRGGGILLVMKKMLALTRMIQDYKNSSNEFKGHKAV